MKCNASVSFNSGSSRRNFCTYASVNTWRLSSSQPFPSLLARKCMAQCLSEESFPSEYIVVLHRLVSKYVPMWKTYIMEMNVL